ncbi:MAG: hypothetical protein WCI72_01640 [archaeon]
MKSKHICAHCGKEVSEVCLSCWRCKSCELDCKCHMNKVLKETI